jgi:hypothetical protein
MHLARLQDSKELGLGWQTHVADLIEHNGTAVRVRQ